MRQGQGPNNRRPRGRHHGSGGGHDRGHHGGGGGHERNGNSGGSPIRDTNRPRSAASLRHQTFDSNCIDLRVRGNAWQVHEKYQALARDAQSAGDRVSAENYLQHAEHYFRIIEAINEATAAEQRQNPTAPRPAGAPGAPPPVPFGQQPETPANYYGTDGRPTTSPANGADPAGGNVTPMAAQAEVQVRNPPPAPSFFPPEDTDEQGESQALMARR